MEESRQKFALFFSTMEATDYNKLLHEVNIPERRDLCHMLGIEKAYKFGKLKKQTTAIFEKILKNPFVSLFPQNPFVNHFQKRLPGATVLE